MWKDDCKKCKNSVAFDPYKCYGCVTFKLDKYEKCLEWYANEDNYNNEIGYPFECHDFETKLYDNGQKARDCLKEK